MGVPRYGEFREQHSMKGVVPPQPPMHAVHLYLGYCNCRWAKPYVINYGELVCSMSVGPRTLLQSSSSIDVLA
jgi:hypothetical protein